ncbi:uncharacterized protein LOC123293691 [Chrysoperla carnea]|uniref:uncharacterized protein LOC123293691 n=1 Tax=Chrysoperla carnea TaxID=189513 RepID=UPI001D08D396|nr:uncharacterized protein LOC123293691 [Chrysoperla carnea]
MEEKSELNFNFTPYPAEIPKLFDSLSDSFKFVMPQSILNESIAKPTSVTIASKHSSYHYQEVPKDTNFQENSHNNSFILNNYFDQYAQANSNSVLENPIQDDIVSDVNEIEFEKGLDNIITSTAKTSYSKIESEQKFQLIQRLDVIPKGMSQIYDDTNTCICRHLSPRTKKELLQKIKRKYEQKLNFDRDLEKFQSK